MRTSASTYQPPSYGQYGAGGVAQGSWGEPATRQPSGYQQQQYGTNAYASARTMNQPNNNVNYPTRLEGNRGVMTMMHEDDSSSHSQRRSIHDKDNGWPTRDRMMTGRAPVDPGITAEPDIRPPPGYGNHSQLGQRLPPPGATVSSMQGGGAGDHERRWSNDIIDHKRYILFVVSDNEVCQQALTMVANLNEVLVRNINSIPATKRPEWLTGVPTLYSVVDNKPYRGVLCMNILQQLSAWELKGPTDIDTSSRMKLHAARKNQDPESYVAAGNHSIGVYVPDADDERKYTSGKLDDGEFEKYKELREKTGVYRPTGVGIPAGGIDQLIK